MCLLKLMALVIYISESSIPYAGGCISAVQISVDTNKFSAPTSCYEKIALCYLLNGDAGVQRRRADSSAVPSCMHKLPSAPCIGQRLIRPNCSCKPAWHFRMPLTPATVQAVPFWLISVSALWGCAADTGGRTLCAASVVHDSAASLQWQALPSQPKRSDAGHSHHMHALEEQDGDDCAAHGHEQAPHPRAVRRSRHALCGLPFCRCCLLEGPAPEHSHTASSGPG